MKSLMATKNFPILLNNCLIPLQMELQRSRIHFPTWRFFNQLYMKPKSCPRYLNGAQRRLPSHLTNDQSGLIIPCSRSHLIGYTSISSKSPMNLPILSKKLRSKSGRGLGSNIGCNAATKPAAMMMLRNKINASNSFKAFGFEANKRCLILE